MHIAKPKLCILILGMHRSGTSCLAGSLQQQGVYLGQVHEWNPHNRKGNRENPKIMALNESLFTSNQGSWDHPPKQSIQWSVQQQQERDQLIQELSEQTAYAWGFKDPRTLINLDFWLDGLQGQFDLHYIGSFRHPLAVAQSLQKRNGTPLEVGLALWYAYNQRLLACWDQQPFPLLSFDVAPEIYKHNFKQACAASHLNFTPIEPPFFESQLRSTSSSDLLSDTLITEPSYLDCYARLQHIYFDWAQ